MFNYVFIHKLIKSAGFMDHNIITREVVLIINLLFHIDCEETLNNAPPGKHFSLHHAQRLLKSKDIQCINEKRGKSP